MSCKCKDCNLPVDQEEAWFIGWGNGGCPVWQHKTCDWTDNTTDGEHRKNKDEITCENFMNHFPVAVSRPNQERGEKQDGHWGYFKTKCLMELSWRGLLKRLFKDYREKLISISGC